MDYPHHLKFVTDDTPGYTRKRWGKGFIFLDEQQQTIKDPKTVHFIKSLVIPPMWEQVWICPHADGYLQSTGKDGKSRKQYIYHPDWINYRQQAKFEDILHFGEQLPLIRKTYRKDLKRKNWSKPRVIALIVKLMDQYYFRVGNKYYSKVNDSFGITTLRRKHLNEESDGLLLSYQAKSGKQRNIKIDNPRVANLIKEVSELPGYEIFRYLDEDRHWNSIDSSDVNDYLKEISGAHFTAKNFRTWGASKSAIEYFDRAREDIQENPRLKFEPTLIKKVAKIMGNTLSVCRKYYVHPYVIEHLEENQNLALDKVFTNNASISNELDTYENILLDYLKKQYV